VGGRGGGGGGGSRIERIHPLTLAERATLKAEAADSLLDLSVGEKKASGGECRRGGVAAAVAASAESDGDDEEAENEWTKQKPVSCVFDLQV